MPPPSPPDSAAGGKRLGRYLLERRIASGGMADVYLATQIGEFGFRKSVALKVLKSEVSSDDDNVRMFLREALVAAEFHHPNLVQVYEVDREAGELFLAMELVRGISAATLMLLLAKKGRAIPTPLAVRIAREVLEGLAYAHEARGPDGAPLDVVHRDVTPQNILVDEAGGVKLVDFGIARAETELGRTQVARVKGKYSYMAPEQWEPGANLDARADLFSLAVTLYEMTTGSRRLFRGRDATELYRAVVEAPVPRPSTKIRDYPADLEAVVMRGLERNADDRWPSARAMADALDVVMVARGWKQDASALEKLLASALDGRPIEERWGKIAAGEIPSPGSETPTVVEEAPATPPAPPPVPPPSKVGTSSRGGAARAQRAQPWELGPRNDTSGEHPRGARVASSSDSPEPGPEASKPAPAPTPVVPSKARQRARWVLVGAAAAGWVCTAEVMALWLREQSRADGLQRRLAVLEQASVHVPRPRPSDPSPQQPVPERAPAQDGALRLAADPPLAATLAAAWARTVAAGAVGVRVSLTPGDARSLVASGRAEMGLFLAPAGEPRTMAERVVGYAALAVIVHPTNPAHAAGIAELAALFAGRAGSVRALQRGETPPRAVLPLTEVAVLRSHLAAGPGTGVETVADDAAAVRAVAADPSAVALVSAGSVNATVRVVPVAQAGSSPVLPTAHTIHSLRYPLVRAVVLAADAGRPASREMVRFAELAATPLGQTLLVRAGLVGR